MAMHVSEQSIAVFLFPAFASLVLSYLKLPVMPVFNLLLKSVIWVFSRVKIHEGKQDGAKQASKEYQ